MNGERDETGRESPEQHWDFDSPGRTVTETDIVMYAGLFGDWMPAHVDRKAAELGIFAGRVAHGPFVLALATGLLSRVPEFYAQFARALSLTTSASSPARLGDTVRTRARIAEDRGDSAVLYFEVVTTSGRVTTSGSIEFSRRREAAR